MLVPQLSRRFSRRVGCSELTILVVLNSIGFFSVPNFHPQHVQDMSIFASVKQTANPVIKSVRRVKVEIVKDVAELEIFDFIVNTQLRLPLLFLSLKFHASFKEYISHRIAHVISLPSASTQGHPPILLVLLDEEDPSSVESHLEEITNACVLNGVRLLLAWSYEEAARILEILHVFGPDRAGDIARGAISTAGPSAANDQIEAQAKEAIQTIQGGVGQKDAVSLLGHFRSVKALIEASKEALTDCPSIGSKKSCHIHAVFNSSW